MTNEIILRLRNDVLNEYRNQKYYLQDELNVIVGNNLLSQRERVNKVMEIVDILATIDAKISVVEGIFQVKQGAVNSSNPDVGSDNVVTNLNPQGQTHSE